MQSDQAIVAPIDRVGLRRTGQRRLVSELITARPGHFTAADLAADARARGVGLGRATIFRTLEALLQAGVVERIDLPDGSHAYVGCAPRHHHHAICSSCGRVVEFDDRDLASVVADVSRRTGFRIDTHRLELFGQCPACQAAEGRTLDPVIVPDAIDTPREEPLRD